MAACAPALFQMMEEAPTKHTMELVVRVRDEGQREKAVQVAVLPFLCAHFKEDKNYLYQVFEEGTSITEKLAELPSTPTIIALGLQHEKGQQVRRWPEVSHKCAHKDNEVGPEAAFQSVKVHKHAEVMKNGDVASYSTCIICK
ncbi:uncharacterized protein LOC142817850 isoform X1 [Rhipicephalus microplus]|uniref:uncharacterized protein LOC142769214 n=1 Tax=Rhipicephalus microplus TaxID=6941 RepID=UPI003F6AC217